MSERNDADAIQLFAESCESLNDFARMLWNNNFFRNTRTGADIRKYETGWRLEKYVEAEIVDDNQLVAAWWLELGQKDGNWVITSNVSVSHAELFVELPEYIAKDIPELKFALEQSVNFLVATANPGSDFIQGIKKL